jgi:putative monooxygenase ydhR
MHILIVKFRSSLSESEVQHLFQQRLPAVSAAPGLLQKYYTREASTGDYIGVHLFDSEESLECYRNCELSRSLPIVYRTMAQPRVELLEVLFQLRAEVEKSGARRI